VAQYSDEFVRNKYKHSMHLLKPLWSAQAHMRFPAFCGVFDRSGEFLITGADDYLVKIWNVSTGFLVFTCRGHVGEVTIIAVSWDNSLFASACTAGRSQRSGCIPCLWCVIVSCRA
jgi:WD40 repeat protein